MRRIGMAVLGLTAITTPLVGQRSALREVHDGGNGSFGANFVVAQPLGEFRRNGDVAAGLSFFGVTSGALALRIDGSWIAYDAKYQGYGVSTLSQIGTIGAGPQLTLGSGSFRVYGFATVGGSLFWSSASYGGCGCSGWDSFLAGHFTTTTAAGAGVLIGLSRGRTPIAIDVGTRAVRHDRVRYVPAGGLTQNSDGSFTAREVETRVDMRVYQIGVSIGIR
jgi:hypothetical protein